LRVWKFERLRDELIVVSLEEYFQINRFSNLQIYINAKSQITIFAK